MDIHPNQLKGDPTLRWDDLSVVLAICREMIQKITLFNELIIKSPGFGIGQYENEIKTYMKDYT